jgi:3-hydroxyacyl-CoA dehydrogenase/enoyl-CoA hydratase/3-hydroxybutyryl-CoA epimerase/3-hydroxyacyl-CoA dehydrogenase/enoyl-CoA hydratase/3-hydroxybutyryl-CoA epimerase/enoyl-CoA isomerase
MSEPTIQLSFPEPDIAQLTFDAPGKGANVFSRHVLEELEAHLNQLEKRTDLAGLIIRSGKPGQFIAGADITEFAAAKDITREQVYEMCTGGRKLFQRLSKTPFVTVAAIDGICLGGGAEISCWCDRRLIADDRRAQIGFPEVKIGIIPGWGGTARAPRMIGLGNAIEMIASGEPVDARTAYSMGLVSDVVATDKLQAAAIGLVRAEQKSKQYLKDRETWSGPLPLDSTELGFLAVTANAFISGQTKGNYPAPIAALNTMVGVAGEGIEKACEAEANGMADLFGTPINRSLINVFLLMDRNKKDTGIDRTDIKPRPIKSVGVFGAGIMGAGIAAAAVRKKIPVTINDAMTAALEKGVRGILEEVSFDKKLKGPSGPKMLENAPLVNATTLDNEFKSCDLVIEAVIENPDIKKQLYARVEPLLGPEAILATNTSTIPIARLAEGLKHPDRFCGIHFFNPVRQMPLVEVIRGPKTSDETVATAVAYAKGIGKSPIVVNDGPGFLVNRLLLPYMNEALELMLDGADMAAIEKAAQRFGMPMGPLTLYDVVGIDTAFYAGHVMYESFPDRVVNSPILAAMVEKKRFGQKTGAGFYKYGGGKKGKGEVDPELETIVGPRRRAQGVKFSTEQIQNRLFLPMVLEATRILEEKVVRDPRDVDLGLIFGTGFPPFKGGLLFWADQIGAAKIVELLKPLESLGERAKPTPMLLDLAAKGRGFYG